MYLSDANLASNEIVTFDAVLLFLLFFSFGVTVNAEAGMTIHSQS